MKFNLKCPGRFPLKSIPVLFAFGAITLSSCVKEHSVDPGIKAEDKATVMFSLTLPANSSPATRSISDENAVTEIDVLVFYPDGGGYYTRASSNTINPVNRSFTIQLPVGTFDLLILANARMNGIIASALSGLTPGAPRVGVLNSLILSTDLDDATHIPMSSEMLAGKVILAENNPAMSGISLYRMVARVDVVLTSKMVGSDEVFAKDHFDLQEIRFYNRNTSGNIVPDRSGGDAGDPAVVNAVLSRAYTTESVYNDSAIATEDDRGISCEGKIYVYEVDNHAAGLTPAARPCLVVGGFYQGTMNYYRVDFSGAGGAYLDILRNHLYRFNITAVNGPGYPTPEDAFSAASMNIEVTIVPWDGGEMEQVDFNGQYYIGFSSSNLYFTQFANPSQQVVTIRTNVPDISLKNIIDRQTGPNDGEWVETGPGIHSNGHFIVALNLGASNPAGDYAVTLTVSTTPTVAGDPQRTAELYLAGANLLSRITIQQEEHVIYRLITSPDPQYTLTLDGEARRIGVDIVSTHPYNVVSVDMSGMLGGVYDAQTGGNLLSGDIPHGIDKIWVAIKAHAEIYPRVASFEIKHANPMSDAPGISYNVIQVKPQLTAVLKAGGGITDEMPKGGGSIEISVTSNLTKWVLVMTINGVPVTGEAELRSYLDRTSGSGTMTVKLTLGMLAGASDRIVKIHFTNEGGTFPESPQVITITQKAILPGGSGPGATPPTSGVRAEPMILSVNSQGQLNLDGDGYIVLFKWGSTVAVSSANSVAWPKNVAWTPEGYAGSITAWEDIKEWSTDNNFPDRDNAKGFGDPCTMAVKGGVTGGYRMPDGPCFEYINLSGTVGNIPSGSSGGDVARYYWNATTRRGEFTFKPSTAAARVYGATMSLPATGIRHWVDGAIRESGMGQYWTTSGDYSASVLYARCMHISHLGLYPMTPVYRKEGVAVRCIPK